jgi:hypothetical protein
MCTTASGSPRNRIWGVKKTIKKFPHYTSIPNFSRTRWRQQQAIRCCHLGKELTLNNTVKWYHIEEPRDVPTLSELLLVGNQLQVVLRLVRGLLAAFFLQYQLTSLYQKEPMWWTVLYLQSLWFFLPPFFYDIRFNNTARLNHMHRRIYCCKDQHLFHNTMQFYRTD